MPRAASWLVSAALMAFAGFGAAASDTGPQPLTKIGRACHVWEHSACQESVDVLSDGKVVLFKAKLAIDADGSPRAYHPGDINSYDDLIDIDPESLFGIQGVNAVGPDPGFYVSGTSLHDRRYPENDTRRWVDAATIPYFVSTPGLATPTGKRLPLGVLGVVVDLRTGAWSGAMYADEGYAVGEGSIALAEALGLNPFSRRHAPKLSGFDGKRFLYIVFPSAGRVSPPWSEADIETRAAALFEAWGGEAKLRSLYPNLPLLNRTAD